MSLYNFHNPQLVKLAEKENLLQKFIQHYFASSSSSSSHFHTSCCIINTITQIYVTRVKSDFYLNPRQAKDPIFKNKPGKLNFSAFFPSPLSLKSFLKWQVKETLRLALALLRCLCHTMSSSIFFTAFARHIFTVVSSLLALLFIYSGCNSISSFSLLHGNLFFYLAYTRRKRMRIDFFPSSKAIYNFSLSLAFYLGFSTGEQEFLLTRHINGPFS